MSKEELKSKFPNTYLEIFQEGTLQERKRLKAEMELKNAMNFKL